MPLSTERSDRDPAGAEPQRRARSPHRSRGERGATLVEYALLVALLAVTTIASLQLLQDGAENTAQSSADRISTRTIPSTAAP